MAEGYRFGAVRPSIGPSFPPQPYLGNFMKLILNIYDHNVAVHVKFY